MHQTSASRCRITAQANPQQIRMGITYITHSDFCSDFRLVSVLHGLIFAARHGHPTMLRCYLALPAIDVNRQGEQGHTPLHLAIENDRSECVKLLLAAPGIDVNMKDHEGRTPLHHAAEKGHSEYVKLLLAAGADIHQKDEKGCTALYLAIENDHTDCVQLLLTAGADIGSSL